MLPRDASWSDDDDDDDCVLSSSFHSFIAVPYSARDFFDVLPCVVSWSDDGDDEDDDDDDCPLSSSFCGALIAVP